MISKPSKGIGSTVLLILIIILALASLPSATSQQLTTSTSILTSSLTQTSTYYISMSTVSTSTGIQTITASASFQLLQGACYLGIVTFTTTGLTQFEFSANGPMALYVVDGPTLVQWSSLFNTGACAPTSGNWQEISNSVTSQPETIALSLPTSGNPYAAVFVASTSENPAATLTVGPVLVAQTLTARASVPVTSTASLTTTLTFATTLEVPLTQTYGSWIAIVIIGALVIAGLFFALRKRENTHRPKQATLTQFAIASNSCVKCGAELPPASDFCNKCGTKQHS